MTTSSEKLTPEADKLDELAQRGGPCDPAGRSPGGVSPMEISMVSIDICNSNISKANMAKNICT